MEEREVLRRLVKKEEAALSWVIGRYTGYVSTIVYNIIGAQMTLADVEEVTSDVFLTLWLNAGRILPGKLKGYLSSVARNKALEKTRQRTEALPLEEDVLTLSDGDLEQDLVRKEQERLVREAVLDMTEPDKEIFLRHYYYIQSVSQISREMNIHPSTVKTKLRRGREGLKKALRKGGYDLED